MNATSLPGVEEQEKQNSSWGLAVAAITLAVLVAIVGVALFFGLRGFF